VEGGFNGVVLQIGLAEKFFWEYAGEVPLILKLNGKTDIPSDAEALSSVHASVEEAVRLGADAVGYTLYVGSPAYDTDFREYRKIRQEAARLAPGRLGGDADEVGEVIGPRASQEAHGT
jgi:class I fructose-bisphosphate aldolase